MGTRSGPPPVPERIVDADEFNKRRDRIEHLVDRFSGDDEGFEALLENDLLISEQNQEIIELLRSIVESRGGMTEGDQLAEVVRLLREQNEGFRDTSNLPVGQAGEATMDIPNGEFGNALFNINGSRFLVEVQATEDVSNGDVVVIKEPGNEVRTVNEDATRVIQGNPGESITDSESGVNIGSQGETQKIKLFPNADQEKVFFRVQDADGSFHVEVGYFDGDGTEITTIDDSDDADLSGGSGDPVDYEAALIADEVELRIKDDSNAKNTVSYNLRSPTG